MSPTFLSMYAIKYMKQSFKIHVLTPKLLAANLSLAETADEAVVWA